VNIFSGEFEAKLDALKSEEAKASEMEHAVRHEIHVKLEEDPARPRYLVTEPGVGYRFKP